MIPSAYRLTTLDVTGSTNDDAKRAAEEGEAEGLVIRAHRQTAGKGRQGRAWSSPEGNLYCSVLLRPHCSAQETGLYSFVVALAVFDAVQAALPWAQIELKWPNDVLVSGKKISGILLEAAPPADGKTEWLVIGVGINVVFFPPSPLYPATSLAAEGGDMQADDVLQVFLQSLEMWDRTLRHRGFAAVREAWLDKAKRGEMRARLPYGEFTGSFGTLDEQGRLILRLADGSDMAIDAGDVFFS